MSERSGEGFDFSLAKTPEESRLAEAKARLHVIAEKGGIVTPGMIVEAYEGNTPFKELPFSRYSRLLVKLGRITRGKHD